MSDATTEAAAGPPQTRSRMRLMHRLALAQAVLVVITVVIALPIAFRSMSTELLAQQERLLFEFPSGQQIVDNDQEWTAEDLSFLNIAAEDLDEASGSITFAVSGHRLCDGLCPRTQLTFYAVADDAHVRRALPPSQSITLLPDEEVFTHTLQLPVLGQPSLYPFDSYTIWLAMSGTDENGGGTTRLTSPLLSQHAVITTQNQLREFMMAPPVAIDPADVHAETDPYNFVGVQEMIFDRPIHLEILAVLLVLLIGVSAVLAVAMRDLRDLVFGIGSLVLAIWGIRSVLVPDPIPVITSIDLALSVVILFVLLGLSLRATRLFQRQSELPKLERWWRRHEG